MNNSIIYSFIAASFFIVGSFLYFQQPATIKDPNTIVVGTNVGYPPYIYHDKDGKLTGFDVELLALLEKKLGKTFVFENMEFGALVIALQEGKVDCIMGGLSITDEKKKAINMIQYLSGQPWALFYIDPVLDQASSINDLKEMKRPVISHQSGTVGYKKYLQQFDFLTLKSFEDVAEMVLDVKYGKSLAGMCDLGACTALKKQLPELKIMVLPGTLDLSHGDGIGIKKDNAGLTTMLEVAIKDLATDGTIGKLHSKWFKS